MVSLKTLLTTSALLLHTATALPANTNSNVWVRAEEDICGVEPTPGIRKPLNGSTITWTAAEQDNYDYTTFEVIYCSGAYFKTSSLHGDIWLSDFEGSPSSNYGAEALALGVQPDNSVAPAGYYGYKTNVSVGPISGSYSTGPRTLTFYEVMTGYYNANNIALHSINLNFTLAPHNKSQPSY